MTDKNIVLEAEVLEADDCWRLLGETNIGRLSVILDDHPSGVPSSLGKALAKTFCTG
jgi:hypothetical protein